MKVIIEGRPADLDLSGKKVTLKNIVEEVENFLHGVGKLPIALKINGKNISQEELLQREDEELMSTTELEFGVIHVLQHVADQLISCEEANKELVSQITRMVNDRRSQESKIDTDRLLIAINDFAQFWAQINSLIPKYLEQTESGGKTLQATCTHFFSEFSAIIGAFERKDIAYVLDLLYYEVLDDIKHVGSCIPILSRNLRMVIDSENNS